jgi:hypothetical protein
MYNLPTTFSWRTALMAALLAFGVFGAVRFLFGSFFSPSVRLAGVLIGLPLGAFMGGYWAGLQTTYRPWLYGLFASGVLLIVAALFGALPYDALVIIVLVLAGGPLGAWLAARGGLRSLGINVNMKMKVPGREDHLYRDLLAMVRQDRYMADRLIDFERRRSPAAPRERLIQDAIERLKRDRR